MSDCASLEISGSSESLKPLRILMVSARAFPFVGGTEAHIHEVSKRLARLGHHVTVLTCDPAGTLAPHEIADGVEIVRVPAWPKGSDWYFAPDLYRHIARGGWDIVHVQGYHTLVAPAAMLAAHRAGIPFVVTFHSGGHSSRLRSRLRGLQCAFLRPLFSRAARCIAVSDFEADHFCRTARLPSEMMRTIPNGASVLAAAVDRAPARSAPLILSIGRLERYKGHHRAIGAMPFLLKHIPDARLRVVGAGPFEAALRRQVASLGLESHVAIGAIPASERSAMGELIQGASLVVLLSEYEAHPVAMIEAVSLGKRALVTATSGLKELADRGLARSISPDASLKEIAAAMAEEIQAPPRSTASIKLPSWEDCCADLVGVYRTAVAGRVHSQGETR